MTEFPQEICFKWLVQLESKRKSFLEIVYHLYIGSHLKKLLPALIVSSHLRVAENAGGPE